MSRQMYFNLIFVTSLLSMGMLSGCATIVKGTTQKVAISSDPEGADVTVDDKLYGQTPVDVSMKRKRDHLVTVSKEGYKPDPSNVEAVVQMKPPTTVKEVRL